MERTLMRVVMLVPALWVAQPAAAQRPPVTTPAAGTTVTTLTHAFDRAAPQPLPLWAPRTVLGFDEVV
ncbi:hypothetical protein B8W90_11810, partial [Staphylococcus hominis]